MRKFAATLAMSAAMAVGALMSTAPATAEAWNPGWQLEGHYSSFGSCIEHGEHGEDETEYWNEYVCVGDGTEDGFLLWVSTAPKDDGLFADGLFD